VASCNLQIGTQTYGGSTPLQNTNTYYQRTWHHIPE
jgi:hypothetical protein